MTATHLVERGHPGILAVIGSLSMMAVVAGCHRTPTSGQAPSLQTLSPSRGDVTQGQVVDVIVTGVGFDSLNTVNFGDLVLRQVPRRSATTLRFTVPLDDVQRPGRGESPPARLPSGPYAVRVTTARGSSNALAFTLLNERGTR